MPRYIDADVAKTDAEERGGTLWLTDGDVKEVKRFLDDQPTADVAPVVHAHWETEPYYDNDEEACYDILSCSHCHYPFTGREYEFVKDHDKLCPECGAIMDEEVKKDGTQ